MHTTAIIVEVLVIGYTSFLWIAPLLFALFDLDFCDLIVKSNEYKEWTTVVALLLTAIAYQIGWLLDYFSYLFFYYVGIALKNHKEEISDLQFWHFFIVGVGRKRKRKWIPDGMFWIYYNVVCQKGSQAIRETLMTDLSVIRFARSGIVNFFLIGVTFLFILRSWSVFIICFCISFGCFLALRKRWGQYYERIRVSYDHLISQCKADG